MKLDLHGLRSRCVFFLVILFAAGGLSYLAGKAWLAQEWNDSDQPSKWRVAARLEPGNAEYWEHLGLYDRWNLEHRNLPEAIHYLQRATQINPRSAEFWSELAAAEETQGGSLQAKHAYEIASADDPTSANIGWEYGSFLLRDGDLLHGFATLRHALENDSSLEASALAECWKAKPDAGAIVEELLPRRSEYYVRAIRYFVSEKQNDAAIAMWDELVSVHQPVSMTDATDLIDALIDEDRIADAKQIWRRALNASAWPRDADDRSLIFNSGFERDFLNGGFDWRETPMGGALFDFDNETAHSGARSLRITFDGTANLNFQNVYEYVPVAPNHDYHFSAYLRTESISTDQGIRFEMFDPQHPTEDRTFTAKLVGTNDWTRVHANYRSGPHTQLLEILLRRAPSEKLDNKLRGTVWVDDVWLIPLGKNTMGSER